MTNRTTEENPPRLYYFTDPMCSWCWGFAPIIEGLADAYRDRLTIALVVGGLRPGTTEPLSAKMRAEILHHWQEVQRLTGQPFQFEGVLPEGFVYDTEPASRATLTMGEIDREAPLAYLRRVQEGFYAHGEDVTQTDTLARFAAELDTERDEFLRLFQSERLRDKTRAHFSFARQMGVRGFPTLVLVHADRVEPLSRGYRALDALVSELDARLASAATP